MAKIVYNNCYGGFNLSEEAIKRYAELKGITLFSEKGDYGPIHHWTTPPSRKNKDDGYFSDRDIPRSDPALVQVVEEMKENANGRFASLAIRELSPGTKYRIDEYDGSEVVMTIDEYEWEIAQ